MILAYQHILQINLRIIYNSHKASLNSKKYDNIFYLFGKTKTDNFGLAGCLLNKYMPTKPSFDR